MRRAFELGFATTYLYAGSRPSFVRVDEVTFRCVLEGGGGRFLRNKLHFYNAQGVGVGKVAGV
jgi:hypothetical protein